MIESRFSEIEYLESKRLPNQSSAAPFLAVIRADILSECRWPSRENVEAA